MRDLEFIIIIFGYKHETYKFLGTSMTQVSHACEREDESVQELSCSHFSHIIKM